MKMKYLVGKRIDTPISLSSTLSIKGEFGDGNGVFSIAPYKKGSLLLSKEITAENSAEAYKIFTSESRQLLNSLSLLTETKIEPNPTSSFFVYRLESNCNNIVFFCSAYPSNKGPVGITLDQNLVPDIEKISKIDKRVLMYIREAILAYTPVQFFLLLCSAAEALAGTNKRESKCSVCDDKLFCKKCNRPGTYQGHDTKNLKEILKSDTKLYQVIYGSGPNGLRNRASHGNLSDDEDVVNPASRLYTLVIKKIKENANISKELKEIESAPRSHTFKYSRFYLQLPKGSVPDLLKLDMCGGPDKTPKFPKTIVVLNKENQPTNY